MREGVRALFSFVSISFSFMEEIRFIHERRSTMKKFLTLVATGLISGLIGFVVGASVGMIGMYEHVSTKREENKYISDEETD